MKGDVLLRQGSYVETVMEESGSTRLMFCFDFFPEDQHPLKVRHYRIEHWKEGSIQSQTTTDMADALALFYERIGGKPEDSSIPKRQFARQLADRIDQGLCIHCGTAEQVIRALCVTCRTLPQFQAVLRDGLADEG